MTIAEFAIARAAKQYQTKLEAGESLSDRESALFDALCQRVMAYDFREQPKTPLHHPRELV